MNYIIALNDIFPVHQSGLHGILISFLFVVLVLACAGALIWLIEHFISPLPAPIKVVIAIVCVILVVIWAVGFIA